MKIIVAGDGKVGNAVTGRLAKEGSDLTVIDSKQSVLQEIQERDDVMVVEGNAASMPVLRAAGVEDADLLIAATSADEINLLCCLTARSMNPDLHTIARVRNPDYAEQEFAMRRQLGLSMAVNPEMDAAREICRLLQYPAFIKRDTFARGKVEIVELKVFAGARLDGVALKNLDEVCGVKVLICVILRRGRAVIPMGDDVLQAGDRIFVTAKSETLAQLIKNLGIQDHRVRRAMIVGGGRLGYQVARHLLESGIRVKVIEKKEEACRQLAARLPKATVIHGEGSSQQLLDSEGLASSDALITLTGIDEENLIISMYATRLGLPKVITRVERMENYDMFSDMGAGSIISPKDLCSSEIVRYARAMQNKTGSMRALHRIADNQAEALEFLVTPDVRYQGVPLKDVPIRKNALIACITNEGHTFIPSGDNYFELDNRVVAVVTGDMAVRDLNDIFAD